MPRGNDNRITVLRHFDTPTPHTHCPSRPDAPAALEHRHTKNPHRSGIVCAVTSKYAVALTDLIQQRAHEARGIRITHVSRYGIPYPDVRKGAPFSVSLGSKLVFLDNSAEK
jgi:hypothetical protein